MALEQMHPFRLTLSNGVWSALLNCLYPHVRDTMAGLLEVEVYFIRLLGFRIESHSASDTRFMKIDSLSK